MKTISSVGILWLALFFIRLPFAGATEPVSTTAVSMAPNFRRVTQGSVKATVRLTPVGSFIVEGNEIEGQIGLESDHRITGQNFVIPVSSLKTGVALRDDHMKNKYLEGERFPTIRLVRATAQNGVFEGEMEIRGTTKKIEGRYEVTGKEMTARFSISLKEFGISGVQYLGVGVKDSVDLAVQIVNPQ